MASRELTSTKEDAFGKNYKCRNCGDIHVISTDHYESIYGIRCPDCESLSNWDCVTKKINNAKDKRKFSVYLCSVCNTERYAQWSGKSSAMLLCYGACEATKKHLYLRAIPVWDLEEKREIIKREMKQMKGRIHE